MGTMCVLSKTLCPFSKGCKWAYLVFQEPRVLPWQHCRCHSISLVIYISGAKFEQHCFNIAGDILDSGFTVQVK